MFIVTEYAALKDDALYLLFCFIVDTSGSENCCIQSNCYQKK